MESPFERLYKFLQVTQDEVRGHELQAPTPEITAQLDRLLNGQCDDAERERICQLIRANPASIRYLAERASER
jgi:hypothetical protein